MKEKSIIKVTIEEAKKLEDLTDWDKIKDMSEDDIERNARLDPDNQPISEDLVGLTSIKSQFS